MSATVKRPIASIAFRLFVAFTFCTMVTVIGCSKYRCQVVSYNAPLTVFRHYSKKLNAVANAIEIHERIADELVAKKRKLSLSRSLNHQLNHFIFSIFVFKLQEINTWSQVQPRYIYSHR
jgi:hypothetical protein